MLKMLGMVLFLSALSVGLSTLAPRSARCGIYDCPTGEKCVTDLDCNLITCNLQCVGVKRLGGPKYCVLAR